MGTPPSNTTMAGISLKQKKGGRNKVATHPVVQIA